MYSLAGGGYNSDCKFNHVYCVSFLRPSKKLKWRSCVPVCVVSWNPRTNNKLRCVLYQCLCCVWSINLGSPASAGPHEPAININLYPDKTNFIHFVCVCVFVLFFSTHSCVLVPSPVLVFFQLSPCPEWNKLNISLKSFPIELRVPSFVFCC